MSLYINCETEQEVDGLWDKLSAGGKVLIPMSQYPFSKKYGWIQDSFGVSWQLNLGGAQQKISPLLMFTGKQNGRAEEAIDFYISIFKNSSKNEIYRYEKGEGGTEGSIKHSRFMLDGQSFMAMDSSIEHAFTFSPATSLFINCETQTEVDELWEKLAEDGGEHGVCGWLTDKFGVSWQIVPTILGRLLGDSDPAKAQRVMKAMLKMKKIDIEGLQKAYEKNNS